MQYSGIVVTVDPLRLRDCADALGALAGVSVHYCYPERGQIVLVQETETLEAQQTGFERIRCIPGVYAAALVHHQIDEEAEPDPPPASTDA